MRLTVVQLRRAVLVKEEWETPASTNLIRFLKERTSHTHVHGDFRRRQRTKCSITSLTMEIFFFPLIPFFLFLFLLERGEGKENKRKRNIHVRKKHQSVASLAHVLTRDQAHNIGMCPDRESNWWPLLCGMMPDPLSCTGQGRHLLMYH